MIRQIDNQAPQSPQKFSPAEFLVWVQRQRLLAKRVVSCYEAGCFGLVLHRKLAEVGVENFVVRPRNWDEYGSSVKTDARDARELCSHLDRYLVGFKFSICSSCQRLMNLRKKRLEDAIDHIFSRNGRLAEPQTA